MSIKFNAHEIRFIALFESMTGAMVKDCILDDENAKVTFVVKNGDMGLAIGKGGSTVTKVKKAVGRGVEIIEHNEDPAQFIKNVLSPAELKSIKIVEKNNDEKIAIVNTDSSNKRIAIGKNGINIETSAITTGINAGLSIASGNPVAIVGGIANIAKAVGEIRSHELSPNQSKGNINSGDCTYAHRNLLFQVKS